MTEEAPIPIEEIEPTTSSFSDFARLYERYSECPGSDVISQLVDLMRDGKVDVDFSVPGVKITFK